MKFVASIWSLAHPFIFACLPVLLLLNYVKEQVLPEEVIPSLVAVELYALVCLLVFLSIFRSIYKAALAASACIVFNFSFRLWQVCLALYFPTTAATTTTPTATAAAAAHPLLAVVSVGAFFAFQLLLIFALLNGKWQFGRGVVKLDFKRLCGSLTAVSIVLVGFNWGLLYLFEEQQEKLADIFKSKMAQPFAALKLDRSATRPDIYYIILDGYASPLTMSEFWHFRDDRLSDYLKERGFYVVPSAASNYDRTEFSLASSLNMQYLNPLLKGGAKPSSYVFMRLVQDNQLVKLLHSLGYRFVQVSSGSFGTDCIPQADQVVRANYVNHFGRALAYLTAWSEIEPYCPILSHCLAQTRLAPGTELATFTASWPTSNASSNCNSKSKTSSSSNSNSNSPKFVLIHTDLPHAPYLFDEHGKRLPLPPGLIPDWQPPEAYFGQWKFCQSMLTTWIGGIMKASGGRAIIIVQSDHGPGIRMKQSATNNWYNERMRIFNAYYLPGRDHQSSLYSTITPVNSFRVVLNDYFKAGLPLLKDNSYCPGEPANAFDWQDVTALLKFPSPTCRSKQLEPPQ